MITEYLCNYVEKQDKLPRLLIISNICLQFVEV